MVNIISNNAALSTKTNVGEISSASEDVNKALKHSDILPTDIVDLSKAAQDAIKAYQEYKTRIQSSASDVNEDTEHTVFDKANNSIKAASQFKAQLAVLEKKSELFEILQSI